MAGEGPAALIKLENDMDMNEFLKTALKEINESDLDSHGKAFLMAKMIERARRPSQMDIAKRLFPLQDLPQGALSRYYRHGNSP